MLLGLCSGKRDQNLHVLDLNHFERRGNVQLFDIRFPVKNHGKAWDVKLQSVDFFEHPYDESLCPVVTLERSIKVTKEFRM